MAKKPPRSGTRAARPSPLRRGRPPKYGQPSRVVAVTLPVETIGALRAIHADIGWAIVTLTENARPQKPRSTVTREAELVQVGHNQALIVVDPAIVKALPDVRIVPISDSQAFLALEPGRGMADLEIGVLDRIERVGRLTAPERTALTNLLAQLRKWRRNRRLTFETRSIILVSQKR